MLSIIVLAWNQLPLTQACVASLRSSCDVPHELIVVDNGSEPDAARWAEQAADVAVLLPENLGFAAGMNAGLAAASGDVVAFVNNDTVWPQGWTGPLLEHFADGHDEVGIVAPAVTAAGNPVTVREQPGDEVVVLDPFSALPSGVVYLLRTEVARGLGGWTQRYRLAMSEDLDLCFTAWSNGLEVRVDTRVLVEHVLHATLDIIDDDRTAMWRENFDLFLDHWTTVRPDDVDRWDRVAPAVLEDAVPHARAAATWLRRMDELRVQHRERETALREQLREAQAAARSAVVAHRPAAGASLLRRVARRLARLLGR